MLNRWKQKCWGRTRCIINTDFYSKHELELVEGGYCSFHYHKSRCNRFRVVEGAVKVVWAFGWRVCHITLRSTDYLAFDIPPNIPHQFQVIESGKMIEEYFSIECGRVRDGDIVRLSEGNKLESENPFEDKIGIWYNADHANHIWEGKFV